MTNFDFDIRGVGAHKRELQDEAADWSKPSGTWHVGTAVEYGVFLEFGTSKMDPKPFFRPALAEAERDLSAFVRDNTETSLEQIDGPRELVRVIALALERRVKEIITEKGLVDTGVLRASVLAVPSSPSSLPDAEDFDPPETGSLPANAGQDLVQRNIEVSA
ncbi:phage protein, HK97 gp10 family [Natronoarchaeum philippinense]|uniref:Phage protein, HK97 gp10 family n=1 Tax=Natronoarchaeum philippinense TaxID=558529 RepID=A0A285PA88_NATPI|nr:hypothetical protein [Natronoarchaeum philippinense]SNZ18167.1 phage protein, HK97 gp10 family [Natronoarchaeum philippinense]